MEAALHDQAELLDETQKMMAAWTKRRQESMEAGFHKLVRLSKLTAGCLADAGQDAEADERIRRPDGRPEPLPVSK